ncbi:hypothetical protein C8P66_13614 [Humitalea rosea]|uniref:ribonucleoside-diphosphate reductase n=1 Tax=Humitalea rosea TaxID=990373 RepID=A0A2W7JT74_9PROT|nr:hypothetical protein [Humitalea rosea]PZW38660.1 hypothetical protein C8P66_13614 [Humitalea rosea]
MSSATGTIWAGVALRRTRAGADPDAEPRHIALPAGWDDGAAAAIAALAIGDGVVSLPSLAEGWIRRLAARGRRLGVLDSAEAAEAFATSLRRLLLARRGAPGMATWRNAATTAPRFVLNLPAFLDGAGQFDTAGYAQAVAVGVMAAEIAGNARATRIAVGFADLAGLLAALALPYAGAEARQVAAGLAALTRGAAEAASGRLTDHLEAREPAALLWPAPPAETVLPGLAEAARAALDAAASAPGLRHSVVFALTPADAVEALLGAESAGLAPAPGPTRPAWDGTGRVIDLPTAAARRAGDRAAMLLAPPDQAARQAMEAAVRPYLHALPPAPPATARAPAAAPRRNPPVRAASTIWRATIGGQRVAMKMGFAAGGAPIEIGFTVPREASLLRAMLDAASAAVTTGLGAGVPLADFVEAYAYAPFGPGGAVEGDPSIRRATSVLDWGFRRLAADLFSRADLPDPGEEHWAEPPEDGMPLLPLDLPAAPSPVGRRRAFRLVG